jgi:hypothetical protein
MRFSPLWIAVYLIVALAISWVFDIWNGICFLLTCPSSQFLLWFIIAAVIVIASFIVVSIWLSRKYGDSAQWVNWVTPIAIGIVLFFSVPQALTDKTISNFVLSRYAPNIAEVFHNLFSIGQEKVQTLQFEGWQLADNRKHFYLTFSSGDNVELLKKSKTVDISYLEPLNQILHNGDEIMSGGLQCFETAKKSGTVIQQVVYEKEEQPLEYLVYNPNSKSYCYEVWQTASF